MTEESKKLCECISQKLVLNPEAVIEWAEDNKFAFVGLAILCGQIAYNKIDTMDIVLSVLNKTKYKIIQR